VWKFVVWFKVTLEFAKVVAWCYVDGLYAVGSRVEGEGYCIVAETREEAVHMKQFTFKQYDHSSAMSKLVTKALPVRLPLIFCSPNLRIF